MDGGEAGELGTGADLIGGVAVDGAHPFQGGAAPLASRSGVSVDLVADPEPELANHPLADMDVPVGGEVARLAAPEEARAPSGDLEDAEHQAAATVRLIRCRMAVSPWVRVMPSVSLRPS